jgi:hypothetical protein
MELQIIPGLLPHLQIVAGGALRSSNLLITTQPKNMSLIEANSVCMVIIQQVISHQNSNVFKIVEYIFVSFTLLHIAIKCKKNLLEVQTAHVS